MIPSDVHFAPLTEVARRVATGDWRSEEVTAHMLHRIADSDGDWRSYLHVLADRAMDQARAADAEVARGIRRGPLHGVPVALKDLCDTTFAPTTGGMPMLRGRIPARNATIVDRIEAAGAICLGKLKMTEGAYTAHHPDDPAPLNPWGPGHWVGSSSTGTGVALAAGLAFAAIGSDTGGSIRFPSATCGLTGVKPTWGRVSRAGILPLADSLDHVGPMARSAADAAALLWVMAGVDPADPTTLPDPVPDYPAHLAPDLRGLTIGIDRAYATEGIDPAVADALAGAEAVLRDLGARIVEIRLPPWQRLVSMWIPACAVETAAHHRDTYPARKADYGPGLATLIESAAAHDGRAVADIHHERLRFAGGLRQMFGGVDLMICPTMPVPTPTLAAMERYATDPELLLAILRFTAPFDFSGSPTVTLPLGPAPDGLPLSFQVVGPHLSEATLLRAAHAVQCRTDWHIRRPPGL
jgi:amidase